VSVKSGVFKLFKLASGNQKRKSNHISQGGIILEPLAHTYLNLKYCAWLAHRRFRWISHSS